MPSDDRVAQVLNALSGARAGFHSAIVSAAGEVEAWLGAHRASGNDRGRLAAERLVLARDLEEPP